jgi:AAA+ ATPase superfamily predicted ATPase
MNILNSRPDLITFVYGPINSGKTELFNHLIGKLSNDYVVFYINLRERMISNFNDFIEALFEIDVKGKRKVVIKELIAEVTKFAGIPISKSLLDQFFKEDRPKNAFRYIVDVVKDVKAKGKIPVLIIDELQKIGDVKINNFLIYELFNLFIRLTKELHCCHVFAVTSDSLFIQKVYSEAMLQGRCRYVLVDDFDYETTEGFLKKYGFSRDKIKLIWNYFGGKPVYLVEAIKNRHRLKEFCDEMLNVRIGQLLFILDKLKISKKYVDIEGEKVRIDLNSVLELFKTIDNLKFELSPELMFLIRENILFLDPVKRVVKPQSKLDLLAIRRILKETKKG